MRRVLAVLIGVAIVIVAGGVAEAAITHRQGGPFGMLALASGDQAPERGAAGPQKAGNKPASAQAARPSAGAPLIIGALEQVTRRLDFGANKKTVLHHPGAEYVKPHFSRLSLLPGDYVKVSDPQGKESRLYSAEGLPVNPSALLDLTKSLPVDPTKLLGKAQGIAPAKVLTPVVGLNKWAMSVPGDTAIVELITKRVPLPTDALPELGVVVDKVARGYSKDEVAAKRKQTESICRHDDKKDAVCYESQYPTEYQHSKPVARLLINGVELCSGWRVGPNNRMLTNHHCIGNDNDAASTEVWFNYQCQFCSPVSGDLPVTKVTGNELLSTDDTLDFSLFTVNDFDSIRSFGYLELDNRRPERGEEIYIPQHPGGSEKQIAISSDQDRGGNCQVDNPSFDGYAQNSDVSYYCDTEGGSSGSPVLSRKTHKVVALHHFGGCPNSGVRIDLITRKIAGKL